MTDKREKTFNSFDGLGDYMRQNGSNVYDEKPEENNSGTNLMIEEAIQNDEEKTNVVETEDPQGENTFYEFDSEPSSTEGNSFMNQSVESKAEYNAIITEDNLIKEIEQAQEVLDEVSGMPHSVNVEGGVVEAEDVITGVSHVETLDTGVVSDADREARLDDAERTAKEIEMCDSAMQRAITADPYLDVLYKSEEIREKLSQKTKDIIRETTPELFEMINQRDVELMIIVEETFKQHGITKGTLGEKIKLAKSKKIVTSSLLDEYNKALKSRDEFIDKARELGVPAEVAKIIFKADPIFIKEIRDGMEYETNAQKKNTEGDVNEDEIVSVDSNVPLGEVIQEEPIPEGEKLESEIEIEEQAEMLSQKEEYKQKSVLFKQFIEKIINESEKERLLNALSTFDSMIDSIEDNEDENNIDHIYNTGDYMIGLEENIKASLNEKQAKIEESEAIIDIISDVEEAGENIEVGKVFNSESYNSWISNIPDELRMTASMAFNPENNQQFKDMKFFTDENNVHYVVYTENNGERQARKMYATEDEFGVSGVTELVDPLLLEGNKTDGKIEEIKEDIQMTEINEVKEKTELEERLEVFRNVINKCRATAHTIKNDENREKILSLLRSLESQTLMVSNDNMLDDAAKIESNKKTTREIIGAMDKVCGTDSQSEEVVNTIEDNSFETFNKGDVLEVNDSKVKREIPAYVAEKYEKYGIGIDILKTVEGFQDLTDGQKLLMLKNYESAILNKTKVEGKSETDKEWNKQTRLGVLGLNLITLGMAKTFREKKKQQELANKIIRGDYLGFENRQAMLESLVEVAKESPDVSVNKEGGLEICYVNENKFRDNAYAKDILSEYNIAATEYSKIPFNWIDSANTFTQGNEKADSYYKKLSAVKGSSLEGKEKAKFSDVRDSFEKTRENYFNLIISEIGDSPENRRYALRELNSLDERVRMNQMFNSDPNAEQALQDIQDEKIFNQTLSEFWSKKGKYMAYGAITRAVAAATVASIAAPIGLIVVRHSSLLRSKREVRDMMKIRRTVGTLSEQDLREDVVYNVDLERSQADLKSLLAKARDGDDLKAVYHLESRLNEVSDKLKSGFKFERRTRKLGEFRDAKFFSDRVEQLVSKYELLKSTKGQEVEAGEIERKIAQTSVLMRELMNNNMLSFGKGEKVVNDKGEAVKDDSASMMNRLKFIQALALADTTVSLDDEKIKDKMSHIVNDRREKMDKVEADNATKYISRQIKYSVAFGAAGYAIGHLASEFFGAPHFESSHDGMIKIEGGDNIKEIINHNIKGLDHLPNNAKDNVIANFLNRLRPEQLKEIGIANPQSLKVGETINLEAMQKLFDNTRVNGRTLVENARIITGEKPLGGQLTQFINNIYTDYKANLREPEVSSNADVSTHSTDAAVNRGGFVSAKTHVDAQPSTMEEASIPARKMEEVSIQTEHTNTGGSSSEMQEDWQDYTIPERIKIADKLIPEYLEKQLGDENMSVFAASAKNMPASALRLTDYSDGGGKAKMLEELQKVLEEKGITPDNGFEYKYNETLYDYVVKAYKLRIIQDGINSVK